MAFDRLNSEPLKSKPKEETANPSRLESVQDRISKNYKIINAFILRELSEEDRQAFVGQLRTDKSLRLAVQKIRSTTSSSLIESNEEVSTLLASQVDAIRQGNGFFPGESYIRGLENRPDIRGIREKWYEKAIALSEKILALGYFEDIALENADRASQNIPAGRQAQKHYGGYSPEGGFIGMITVVGNEGHLSRGEHPASLQPVNIEMGPADLSLESSRGGILSVTKTLSGLFPRERGYISYHDIDKPFANPKEAHAIWRRVIEDESFREDLKKVVSAPYKTAKPVEETAGKMVAVKLLLKYGSRYKDENSIKAVTDEFGRISKLIAKGSVQEQSEHLMHALYEILSQQSKRYDITWKVFKPELIKDLKLIKTRLHNKGILDAGSDFPYQIHELGRRFQGDKELQSIIFEIALGGKNYNESAIATFRHMDPAAAVPACFNALIMTGGRVAAFSLQGFSADEINSVDLSGETLSKKLKIKKPDGRYEYEVRAYENNILAKEALSKVNTAAEIIEVIINWNTSDGFSRGRSNDSIFSLMETLNKLDPQKAESALDRCLKRNAISMEYPESVFKFFEELGFEGYKDKFLAYLGKSEIEGYKLSFALRDLAEKGITEEDYRQAVFNAIKTGQREVDQSFLLAISEKSSAEEMEPYLLSALASKDVYLRICALNQFKNNPSLLTPAILGPAIDLSFNRDHVNLGFMSGTTTEADVVEKALISCTRDLGIEKMGSLYRQALALEEAGQMAQDISTASLNRVTRYLALLDTLTPENYEIHNFTDAVGILFHKARPNTETLRHFLLSFSVKEGEWLSNDMKSAREFVKQKLGEKGYEIIVSTFRAFGGLGKEEADTITESYSLYAPIES